MAHSVTLRWTNDFLMEGDLPEFVISDPDLEAGAEGAVVAPFPLRRKRSRSILPITPDPEGFYARTSSLRNRKGPQGRGADIASERQC
jgi:hypothetical protein